MNFSKELLNKAKAAKSAEELLALAAENGITLTAEEAEAYFTQIHNEVNSLSDAIVAVEELENVAGGSQCKGGKTYSSDYPYNLIVTAYNSCPLWNRPSNDPDALAKWCISCGEHYSKGATLYCQRRTINYDPYR